MPKDTSPTAARLMVPAPAAVAAYSPELPSCPARVLLAEEVARKTAPITARIARSMAITATTCFLARRFFMSSAVVRRIPFPSLVPLTHGYRRLRRKCATDLS